MFPGMRGIPPAARSSPCERARMFISETCSTRANRLPPLADKPLEGAAEQSSRNVRGSISPQVRDGVLLNLIRDNSKLVPVTRHFRIVDVPPDNLIWAQHRPPKRLSGLRKSECHRLRHDRRAGRWVVRDGRHQRKHVLVRERRRARKVEGTRHRVHGDGICERLSNIHNLRGKSAREREVGVRAGARYVHGQGGPWSASR